MLNISYFSNMQSFLTDVISDLFLKYKDISKCTFVLPSIRAGVFLKQEIKNKLNKPCILPKIISIEDFIADLSSLSLIDNTKLLFEFYTVYLTNPPKDKINDFDTFSNWATTALNDFNEIDRHRIDANYIFNYLQDINRLENWNIENKTGLTKNYFSFFGKLHTYYNLLNSRLLENRQGYQGMLYKEAIENIDIYIENSKKNKSLVFIGFNALNKSEEILITQLLNNDVAEIYWDCDEYYFDDNPASIFLKKYKTSWNYFTKNSFNWINNNFSKPKSIEIIGCSKNNTQLKHVGQILANNVKHNFQNIALVLADETLLPLALNSLPKNVLDINITMGYDLRNVETSKLFNLLFKLYINSKNNKFYYRDVIRVLQSSPIKSLYKTETLINTIIKNNFSYLNFDILSKLINDNDQHQKQLLFIFKKQTNSINSLLEICVNIIERLKAQTANKLDKEFLFRLNQIFNQIISLNKKYNYLKDLKTLNKFYTQLLSLEKLSFKGEPLSGLQLMGVLETRVLDFETIILTSVNEGTLPSGKTENSFIPYDVKKEVGLPTYQEKDAIFSYHFFRLLQRAKNIYLLYNTESDQYGSGEKSRFITQLELNSNHKIEHKIISPKTTASKIKLKNIVKSPKIITELQSLASNGFSPSTLTSYIYNPIDFYKQKVLRIKETEEVEETIAMNTLGTIIHKTLETLYTPIIGKVLIKEDIEILKSKISIEVKNSFEKEYLNGDINSGKNLIVYNIAKQYISNFLALELSIINSGKRLKILALEHDVETIINIKGFNFPIKLKGQVDRIDEIDGLIRIIDYKTGKVEQNEVEIFDWENITKDYKKYSKSFQIIMYTYMLEKSSKISLPVEAGIISFKNLNSGFLKFGEKDTPTSRTKKTLITKETLENFETQLKKLILELFDLQVPFTEKENI